MADGEACDVTVYANWGCSKCRATRDLLDGRGTSARYVEYLRTRPDRDELERLLAMLGSDDPRTMMRTGDALYAELGLAGADRDGLLDAVAAHPALLERPIVVRGGRAVIARPPERALALLADQPGRPG